MQLMNWVLFAEATAQTEAATSGNAAGWGIFFTILLAVFVVPFGGAYLLSKRWRMPTHYWRFAWALFAVMFGVTIVTSSALQNWENVKLGIDLKGGTILVYELKGVDAGGITQEGGGAATNVDIDMDELTTALKKRVDPDSVKDVTIRSIGNNDQVEIIIPEVDPNEIESLKNKISSLGTLEFRIVANTRDHTQQIQAAMESKTGENVVATERKVMKDGQEVVEREIIGWWVPIAPDHVHSFNGTEARRKPNEPYNNMAAPSSYYTWRHAKGSTTEKPKYEIFVVNDPFDVQGKYLTHAYPSLGELGKHAVNFQFNAEGASLFHQLTLANQPVEIGIGDEHKRQLGIILNNELQSAPSLNSPISNNGQITGDFTLQEATELANILKAGRLPAVLSEEPSSVMTTGATLGIDTINRAKYAMVISVLLIMAIMLFYYRFAGIVAVVSLILLTLLTFSLMVAMNAAFTLPGLAGLVLTIGMAVDANILIYERIREETDEKNSPAQCVRNGFGKAWSAIVDSNITTILVGVILFSIGTEQIRGFAIILLIGIIVSMFSAIYVGRTIFDVAIRFGYVKEFKMRRIFPPTSIPFMKYARTTLLVSGILMFLSIGAVFARVNGSFNATSLFDIDFLGGNTLQVLFNEQQSEEKIYNDLADQIPDLAVTDVTLQTDADNNMLFRRYNLTTPVSKIDDSLSDEEKEKRASADREHIKNVLMEKYPGGLMTNKMDFALSTPTHGTLTPETAPAPLPTTLPETAAPAIEAPVVETPAPEVPAAETPAVETPAPVAPEAEAPAVETLAPVAPEA
ncbi:MAG: protein translocase subunit SecD, partial [Planctomycetia bacterium]|nr:protein translocase subunit SecD [Planctomycetia bacterium]